MLRDIVTQCASAIPQQRQFYVKPLELGRRAVKLDDEGPRTRLHFFRMKKKGKNEVSKAI